MTETAQPMKRRRPWRRRAKVLAAIMLVVILAASLLLWLANGAMGRNLLASRLSETSINGQHLQVDGVSGHLLSRFAFARIAVQDKNGTWAEIDNAQVSWRPLRLLTGRLDIADVRIGNVHVLRNPDLPAAKVNAKGGTMPVRAISVRAFAIDAFTLDAGVTPKAIGGSLHGNGNYSAHAADLVLQVKPGETGSDSLHADLHWHAGAPLNGQMDLNGPAGGLFASLLRLAPDQHVRANMHFGDAGNAASGAGKVWINDQEWIGFTAQPQTQSGQTTTQVQAHIALPVHPDTAQFVSALGPDLKLQASLLAGRQWQMLDLSARARGLELDLAPLSAQQPVTQYQLRLALSDPAGFLPADTVQSGPVRIKGMLSRPGGNLAFDGQFSAETLSAHGLSLQKAQGPLHLLQTGPRIAANIDWQLQDLALTGGDPPVRFTSASLAGKVDVDLAQKALALTDVRMASADNQLTATGTAAWGNAASLSLHGKANVNLAALPRVGAGTITGQWQLQQSPGQPLAAMLDLSGSDLKTRDPQLQQWLGSNVHAHLTGALQADGSIQDARLSARSAAGDLQAKADMDKARHMQVQGKFIASARSPLHPQLPGAMIDLSANGAMDDMAITMRASADKAQWQQSVLQAPQFTLHGTWRDRAFTGTSQIAGQYDGAPTTLSGQVRYGRDGWAVRDVHGDWRDLRLRGGVSGQGADVKRLRGDVDLTGTLPASLHGGDINVQAGANGDTLQVAGQWTGFTSAQLGNGKVVFHLKGSRADPVYDFDISGTSNLAGGALPVRLQSSGRMSALDTDTPGMTGSLHGTIGDAGFASTKPFHLRQGPHGPMADVQLHGFGGDMRASINPDTDTPVEVDVTGVQIADMLALAGRDDVQGKASLQLRMVKSAHGVTANLSGAVQDIRQPGSMASAMVLQIKGQADQSGAQVHINTPASQPLQASLRLQLPLHTKPAFPWVASNGASGPVQIKLDGPVDTLAAMFLPGGMTLKGTAHADLRGTVPDLANTLTGEFALQNGVYRSEQLGIGLDDITVSGTAKGAQISINTFTAKGNEGGTVQGSGRMSIRDGGASSLNLTAQELAVSYGKEVRTRLSGDITLGMDAHKPELTGDLQVVSGTINLDAMPQARAPTLDVVFADDAKPAQAPAHLALNLNIKADHGVKVIGKGVNAELSVDAHITGTDAAPSLAGDTKIVRGYFAFAGKRFTFTDGKASFAGKPDEAALDITATHTTPDMVVSMHITGTPKAPKIAFSADNGLPESEILSRMLFNRSSGDLSPLEKVRLAIALASFATGSHFDPVRDLADFTGLDNLDVTQNTDGQIQVTTGRYLANNIYVQLISNGLGTPGVNVEWEAKKNLSVVTQTNPNGSQTLTIQWKTDFD